MTLGHIVKSVVTLGYFDVSMTQAHVLILSLVTLCHLVKLHMHDTSNTSLVTLGHLVMSMKRHQLCCHLWWHWVILSCRDTDIRASVNHGDIRSCCRCVTWCKSCDTPTASFDVTKNDKCCMSCKKYHLTQRDDSQEISFLFVSCGLCVD